MKNKWVSFHIYIISNADEFLVNEVQPLVFNLMDLKLISKYFFIRYFDNRFHIRLRVKPTMFQYETKIKEVIKNYLANYYINNQEAFKKDEPFLKEEIYEPEILRYGGELFFPLAESFFHKSSITVLEYLKSISSKNNYEEKLGFVFSLHLYLCLSVFRNLNECYLFFEHIYIKWIGFANDTVGCSSLDTIKIFNDNFNKGSKMYLKYTLFIINSFFNGCATNSLSKWDSYSREFANNLIDYQNSKKIFVAGNSTINTGWYILESQLHMTNNRIGILNKDESFLFYLIMRSIGLVNKNITL